MKSIKEKLEIEYLKSLTYTEINEKMNMLNEQINQLKNQSIQLMQTAVVGQSEQLTCDCGKLPDEKYDPCCSLECWHEMFT